MGKISRKTLNKVFIRSQINQFSHNYERMQSLGFTYILAPALNELYEGKPQEEKVNAMNRQLEFFNTHPVAMPFILGVTMALEEATDEDDKESVIGIRTGLMGPFAGLGDSMLNLTWFPIAGSIGASLSVVSGSILGPLVMFLMINVLYWPLKYFGLYKGYEKGMDLLNSDGGMAIFDRISNIANVLGVFVVGALIPNTVKVMTPIKFAAGEGSIALQDQLNSIMPSLLAVIVVGICYKLIKKSNGKHTARIIIGAIIISILLSMAGILA